MSSAEFYDSLGQKYEAAFAHDPGLREFLQKALGMLPAGCSTLDIGSGTGVPTAQMVTASGRSVHGIDFSSKMIELSRARVPEATFEQIDILDYEPASGAAFDAAFAIFALFGFDREQMAVVSAKWPRWIKPGGYLFIGTMVAEDFDTRPEMFDADGLFARGVQHKFLGDRSDNMRFTKEGWRQMLAHVGFDIVFTDTKIHRPPPELDSDVEPHYYIAARRQVN